MKRPLFVIGFVYACATWAAFLVSPQTAFQLSVLLLASGVAVYLSKWHRRQVACVILLTTSLSMVLYAQYCRGSTEPFRKVEGEIVEVQGLLLEQGGYPGSVQYTMLADFPGNPELPDGKRITVSSYRALSAQPGDSVRCLVYIRLPENSNSEGFYRSRGTVALGYLQGELRPAEQTLYRGWRALVRLREWMNWNLYRNLPEESAQIVGAMVLGRQGDVDSDTYSAINRAGTSHLLAVSGLHLSILSAFLLRVLRGLRMPRRLQYALVLLASFLFAGLVGFSASITRALVMTSVTLLGGMLSRKGDSRNSLGFALLVICIVCPYWVLGKGLWLSAASTLGIILFCQRVETAVKARAGVNNPVVGRAANVFLTAFSVSVAAYCFTLPILLLFNGWFSLISPVANMLAAPFVAPLILGGIFSALTASQLFPAQIIYRLTELCVSVVVDISRIASRIPFAVIALDELYLVILLGLFVVMAGVVLYFRGGRKLAAYALALCIFCAGIGHLSWLQASRNTLELVTVEGCNSAVLLRQREAVILGTPSRYDVGRLLRYLEFRGVEYIPAVIAPDHPEQVDSGLLRLQERYGIGCVVGPDDAYILSLLERALPEAQVFSAGYAEITVLGCAQIGFEDMEQTIRVSASNRTILKNQGEYAIMAEGGRRASMQIYRGGVLLLTEGVYPAVEPVGRALYGETRVRLQVERKGGVPVAL